MGCAAMHASDCVLESRAGCVWRAVGLCCSRPGQAGGGESERGHEHVLRRCAVQLDDAEAIARQLRQDNDMLKQEKDALQHSALQLSDKQMELVHANKILMAELKERARAPSAGGPSFVSDTSAADGASGSGLAMGTAASSAMDAAALTKAASDASTAAAAAAAAATKLAAAVRGNSMMESTGRDGGAAEAAAEVAAAGGKRTVVDIAEHEGVLNELAELKLEFALGQVRPVAHSV